MSLANFELVLERTSDQEPVEVHLHGFGEPLLDPDLPTKIKRARRQWHKAKILFFTTLGVECKPGYLRNLVNSRPTAIRISCYGFSPASYRKIHGVDRFELFHQNLCSLVKEQRAAAHQIELHMITTSLRQWPNLGDKESILRTAFLNQIRDMGIIVNESFNPHNYGGGRNYRSAARSGICSIAWGWRRHILQVTWDLAVIPCCFDFDATIRFGSLETETLPAIFSSRLYQDFLTAHRTNQLAAFPICYNCERCFLAAPDKPEQ